MPKAASYFRHVFDELPQPLFLVAKDGTILATNKAFRDFTGLSDSSLPLLITLCPTLSPEELELAECLTSIVCSQGIKRARVQITPFQDGTKLLRVRGEAFENILENVHNQRIETLGRLAGGVAHDFNNILTGILGHVSFLKATLKFEGTHADSLGAIEDGARRASLITQQILNFSRADSAERPERVDISSLTSKTFILLRGAISPRYEINCSIPQESLFVLADEGRIAQVLINLVMNARDAINVDGKVNISLERTSDVSKFFPDSEVPASSYVCLRVEDNGHGMSPDVLKRIFEPYFSTKQKKGTGLGLAMVDTIVKLYGGFINVVSTEKRGTSVEVYFPAIDEIKQDEVQERPRRIQGGDERILIIDDEEPVRNVLAISLEHLGYTVDAVSSGIEGVMKYQEKPYDLVLLDMIMPQLSGVETFVELQHVDPKARVLIISGYASPESIEFILKRGGKGFVPKPFTIEELARRVRDALDTDESI